MIFLIPRKKNRIYIFVPLSSSSRKKLPAKKKGIARLVALIVAGFTKAEF